MQIKQSGVAPLAAEADVLVVPIYEDDVASRKPLADIDKAVGGRLTHGLASGELKGKLYESALWPVDGAASSYVMLAGAGKKADADADRMRRVYAAAARRIRSTHASAALCLRSDAHAQLAAEGFVWGAWESDLYKSKRSETKLTSVTVLAPGSAKAAVTAGGVIAEGVNLARELVCEPPNELTPTRLAERTVEALKDSGVKVDVLRGKKLDGFGGLLGVAKGSAEPPVFITMAWEPSRAKKTPVLGLVGKGVTFDSGGLSLKPAEAMTGMKGDMAGAAAVIGAMQAIAALKVPLTVRAAVPATENMPSGTATRVGDVLTLHSGKTAEILNTDAEGRLILADALSWLSQQGVTHMADAATLTGAVVIALGDVTFGVMGRPDPWVNTVVNSARRGGERAWPLPLYRDYREQINSDIADMKNVGGRGAGPITAGWFLAEAVPDDVQWAHLDIAGVAFGDKKPYRAAGGTGAGVAAFVRLAQDLAGRKS